MLRISVVVFIFSALLASCGKSADQRVPEIADKYCGCFESLQENLSAPGKKIFKKAAEGADEDELAEEREKLSEDELAELDKDAESIRKIEDKNSKVYKCITKVDNEVKNLKTRNRDKFFDNLIREMKKSDDCFLGAFIFAEGRKALKNENAE